MDKRDYLNRLEKADDTIFNKIMCSTENNITFKMDFDDDLFEAIVLAVSLIKIRIKELKEELEE